MPKRLTSTGLFVAGLVLAVLLPVMAEVHVTRPGDSLWTIARKHGVSVQALAKANGLKETSTLPINSKISIPGTTSVSTARPVTSGGTGGTVIAMGVVSKSAPLRSEPSSSSRILTRLPAGKQVKILQTKWHWHEVKTVSGSRGWVGDYLVNVISKSAGASNRGTPRKYTTKTLASKPASKPAVAVSKARPSSSSARVASSTPRPTGAGSPAAVRTAYNYLGARYRYGGTSRGGFDCSGFTRYVYAKHGVSLPHSSRAQYSRGQKVSKSELKEGDLVFFTRGGRGIGHVGIYVGNNKFVHASNPRSGVKVDSLSGSYARKFVGARRVK